MSTGRVLPFKSQLVAAAFVALFAVAVSLPLATVPSLWFDEAATVAASQRSFADLWALIQNVDAVHAAYYAFMHVWLGVSGYSPLTLRLPSVVAVALTAAFVVLLGNRLVNARVGWVAGVLFALLPRVTYSAIQGRSYAIAVMLTTLLTLLLIVGTNHPTRRVATALWTAYAVVGVIAVNVFLYSGLVFLAHAAYVWLTGDRRSKWSWLVAAVVVGAGSAPVVLLSAGQTKQVSWLAAPTWQQLVVDPWAFGNQILAGALLVAVAIGSALLWRSARAETVLLLAWACMPILLVWAVSVIEPLYNSRYVSFTAPAAALMAAAAVAALLARALMVIALVGVAVLSLPTWVQQRSADFNDGARWRDVAQIITDHRCTGRNVAVYGPLPRHETVSTRLIASAYPSAFDGMRDLTLVKSGPESATLWGVDAKPLGRVNRLSTADVVWVIGAQDAHVKDALAPSLNKRGFAVNGYWTAGGVEVARYLRGSSCG